jgi:prevent-host-death family protein
MTILPLNDEKTRFSAIADEVAATHDRVIVTRNGRPHGTGRYRAAHRP